MAARRPAGPLLWCAAAAGFGGGFVLPFVFAVQAWPEIVVPAYFVARGGVLYDTISFIHTPLLILTTAAAGKLFGFSATLFRVIVGVLLGACCAMLVASVRPKRLRSLWFGFLAALPFFLLAILYAEEPSLWPDALVTVFFLGGALLLERFEQGGSSRALLFAALTFGVAVLMKQTAAWGGIAATVWLVVRSRRATLRRHLAPFVAAFAAPYALFVVVWAVWYRTLKHVAWTFILPVASRHASEIRIAPTTADVAGALVFYVVVVAFLALRAAAPAQSRFRTAAPWIAAGAIGMAWPRWEVVHISGGLAVLALLFARSIAFAPVALRRVSRGRLRASSLAPVGGVALLLAIAVSSLIACVPLIPFSFRGPVLFWDDSVTERTVADVARHVAPGSHLLLFNVPFETVYVRTGTTPPDDRYVNPTFWYYLNKFGIGERIVDALQSHPETPILFHDLGPEDDPRGRDSVVYRYLVERTRAVAPGANGCTWRVVIPRVARSQ